MSLPFTKSQWSEGHWYGVLWTMCHVITHVTANHRLSVRTVRVLPVRSLLNTHTLSLLVFVCGKCYRLPQFSRNALRLWLYLTSLSHQISWIHELSLRVVISLVKIFCAISAIGFNRFSVSNTYSSRVAEIHIYHILLERSNVGVFQSEQQ